MQYARCFVQLSGDLGTQIAKAPVTPAEIVLLRAIHGPDAISRVELLGGVNDKKPHAEEMARLREHYTAMTEDGVPVIDKVFPGHAPQLPTTFIEIGIVTGVGDDAVPLTAKEKKAVEKAAKAAAKAAAEAAAADQSGANDTDDDSGDSDEDES